MSREKLLVTQSGADTFTNGIIETGLTADGKSGWSIKAIEMFWQDGYSVPAGDWTLDAKVTTVVTDTLFGDDDEIGRWSWACQNTGGVAVALPLEQIGQLILIEPRVTVQPVIYCQVKSGATTQANDVVFVIYYDIVKLTDIEVLRLLAGGA